MTSIRDKLEPATEGSQLEKAIPASVAISLKRIADALEKRPLLDREAMQAIATETASRAAARAARAMTLGK